MISSAWLKVSFSPVMAISLCHHRLGCCEECGPGRGTYGCGYPPLRCQFCLEPSLSTSLPSNWQHPAFAYPLRHPWDQPPVSKPTSPKSDLLSFTLVAASLQTALPQVLHATARLTKVQMSFPAGLCPSHLKISITNKQWQLFIEAFQGLSPPTTHFFHLERSKEVVLRNISLMWATPPHLWCSRSLRWSSGFVAISPARVMLFTNREGVLRRPPLSGTGPWHRVGAHLINE